MLGSHNLSEGLVIAAAGMAVVFAGLTLIWLAISLFNWFVIIAKRRPEAAAAPEGAVVTAPAAEVPREHLLAIGIAVELYRRLHLEVPESAVTFERGDVRTGWKVGFRYGQRQRPAR
ncbi:MAG: OadG family protein [bacterium]|jgi:Na+-transporting methylmalonyl-CoA/oxaloacetate decarboxylase gamma subunit|nr:OadG family protein [candidate division KSB1 bacterium]MDH7559808.1 OadG family protein [bacterium]